MEKINTRLQGVKGVKVAGEQTSSPTPTPIPTNTQSQRRRVPQAEKRMDIKSILNAISAFGKPFPLFQDSRIKYLELGTQDRIRLYQKVFFQLVCRFRERFIIETNDLTRQVTSEAVRSMRTEMRDIHGLSNPIFVYSAYLSLFKDLEPLFMDGTFQEFLTASIEEVENSETYLDIFKHLEANYSYLVRGGSARFYLPIFPEYEPDYSQEEYDAKIAHYVRNLDSIARYLELYLLTYKGTEEALYYLRIISLSVRNQLGVARLWLAE